MAQLGIRKRAFQVYMLNVTCYFTCKGHLNNKSDASDKSDGEKANQTGEQEKYSDYSEFLGCGEATLFDAMQPQFHSHQCMGCARILQ